MPALFPSLGPVTLPQSDSRPRRIGSGSRSFFRVHRSPTRPSSSKGQCRGFCFRHHVVVVQSLSKLGMRGDLGIPDAKVGVGEIVSRPFSRAPRWIQRDPLAAETFVGEQRCRRPSHGSRAPGLSPSAIPSSIDWLAPCPRCGSIGCAASPSRVSLPGSRSATARGHTAPSGTSPEPGSAATRYADPSLRTRGAGLRDRREPTTIPSSPRPPARTRHS